ncbi:hypothetical protein COY17_02940 [Candidatus Saccharibacteria bacterium CG_4_10_14_0_2_um_filter_52_9]|nr:MAG: hypothetical protein COY17_02940 [Candidatus Saccharibacteria bacterium CG_4_10_14_0_2_um_filter_52_9]
MLEQQLEQDIKAALLSGDKQRALILRGLKATLLNVKVASGKRALGLTDEEVLPVLAKQAKQRQESADLYIQGGDQARADAELAEKAIIETYLPAQLNEAEITKLIDEVIAASGASGPQAMGQVIGQVKAQAGATAAGGVIARLVKEKLA